MNCTLPTWSCQQRTSEHFVRGGAALGNWGPFILIISLSDISHSSLESQFTLTYFSFSFYAAMPQFRRLIQRGGTLWWDSHWCSNVFIPSASHMVLWWFTGSRWRNSVSLLYYRESFLFFSYTTTGLDEHPKLNSNSKAEWIVLKSCMSSFCDMIPSVYKSYKSGYDIVYV